MENINKQLFIRHGILRVNFFFFIFFFFIKGLFAQKVEPIIKTKEITINYSDGREVFNICVTNPKIDYDIKKSYKWYNESNDQVMATQGSAGGSVLHGKYQLFYDNGNLQEESNFKLGLLDGSVMFWDSTGIIKSVYKFDNGKITYYKNVISKDTTVENFGIWNFKGSVEKTYVRKVLFKTRQVLDTSLNLRVTYYHDNGKVEADYLESVLGHVHGYLNQYHYNGKIEVAGKFKEGYRYGTWVWYKDNGIVDYTQNFRINKEYYPNGKLRVIGGEVLQSDFDSWVKNQLWVWYKEDGEIDDMKAFHFGKEREIKPSDFD